MREYPNAMTAAERRQRTAEKLTQAATAFVLTAVMLAMFILLG